MKFLMLHIGAAFFRSHTLSVKHCPSGELFHPDTSRSKLPQTPRRWASRWASKLVNNTRDGTQIFYQFSSKINFIYLRTDFYHIS